MAFVKYHNLVGATRQDNVLIDAQSGVNNIKSILFTNIHDTNAATISLNLVQVDGASSFSILKSISIPAGISFLLDDKCVLNFDNTSSLGFGLQCTIGSSVTVDVLINI